MLVVLAISYQCHWVVDDQLGLEWIQTSGCHRVSSNGHWHLALCGWSRTISLSIPVCRQHRQHVVGKWQWLIIVWAPLTTDASYKKNLDTYSGISKCAPRCGFPSLVIFTWVSPNIVVAFDSHCILMTSQVFEASGMYPNNGPKREISSHHMQRLIILPVLAALSAYQNCCTEWEVLLSEELLQEHTWAC